MQCLDVPDNAYFDGKIADAAVAKLAELKTAGRQFFLAVGFWKPHLPFNALKKYWDLYDRAKIAPPGPTQMPTGAPAMAWHNSEELRTYGSIPRQGPIPPELTAELRHGYYAGISFLDAQVGRVVAELDRLGLAENMWPAGGVRAGEKRTAPVSALDIVPTLLAATGATTDPARPLDGLNLLTALRDPAAALPGDRRLYWRCGPSMCALREGDWKILKAGVGDNKNPDWELYNLAAAMYLRKTTSLQHIRINSVNSWPYSIPGTEPCLSRSSSINV